MKAFVGIQLSVEYLAGPSWTALLLCICCLPRLAVASYESDVQIAAELWVDITYQDYLYLNGTISKEEWIKEQSDFRRSFQHIKGNDPGQFEKDFAGAVAKILHIKNTQKAALMAIKAAPECVSVEEYRDDVWRGSRIKTKANEDEAQFSDQ